MCTCHMRRSNPKRRSIVTMRERRHGGRTLSFLFRHESDAIKMILANFHKAAKIRTDDASHWNMGVWQFLQLTLCISIDIPRTSYAAPVARTFISRR